MFARIAQFLAAYVAGTGTPLEDGESSTPLIDNQRRLVIAVATGAGSSDATAANQATEIAALNTINAKIPALVSGRTPVDGSGVTQPISAVALPLPTGAALDATLTGGTQKAIVRGGAKGATAAADVTSTANGVDHQGADIVEQFAPAYEDNTASRALVEQRNSFANITSATTTTVKVGAGFFHRLTINLAVASATVTMFDNTAGSGTKIGTITMPATLLASQVVLDYDVTFATGLTLVTVGAQDITVAFR